MLNAQEIKINFLKMEQNAASLIEQCNNYEGLNLWAHVRTTTFLLSLAVHRNASFTSCNTLVYSKFECSEDIYKFLLRMPKKCFMICTFIPYHCEEIKGKAYDPYMDPVMLEALKNNIPTVKFTISNFANVDMFIPATPLLFQLVEKKECNYNSNKINTIFPWYAAYAKMCAEYNVPQIEDAIIMQTYLNINAYAKIYEKILGICRPSILAFSYYYNFEIMGIALACSRLNIPTIEMQHGLQSSPHMAYNFSNIPKNGYSIIPKYFFHWGEKASKNMQQQFENQDYHKSFIVGKPAYIANMHGDYVEDEVILKEFLQKIKGYIPICVALPISDKSWQMLEEIIRKSPKEWIWLFRQHPMRKNNQGEEVKNLKDIFGDRVEEKCATALSLHTTLQHSKHLLTDASSSINEAIGLYHMFATAMDAEALDYFNMAIQDGYVDYCTTVHDILASIQKGVSQYPSTIDTQEVTHDTSLMGKTLRQIYDMNR